MSSSLSQVARRVGASLAFADAIWTRDSVSALSAIREQFEFDDTALVCLGWPVRVVLEARKKDKDDGAPKKASYTFDMNKVEGDARGELLRALQEKKFEIIWELLKGQVICIPDLTEENHAALETVLKKYKLKTAPVKEAVEPLLVSLFLLEFYSFTESGQSSQVITDGGDIRTGNELAEEILLLESAASFKTWLTAMFPNCDMEYIVFLTNQAPKP